MPTTPHSSHGVGFDSTFPTGYSEPTPVQEFRWETDGVLKWKKSAEDIMSGGSYVIQYSDNAGVTWADLTTVTQASITGDTGTYRDTTGSEGRLYQIKKLTSESYGSKSSVYVGWGAFWEAVTDKCYVLCYVRQINIDQSSDTLMKVKIVAGTATYATYKNKTIIPVVELSVKVEANSGLLIIPLIPSANLTINSAAATYTFTIVQGNQTKIEFTGKTVPSTSRAFLIDLS